MKLLIDMLYHINNLFRDTVFEISVHESLTKLLSGIKVVIIGLVDSELKSRRIAMFSELLLHLSKIFVSSVKK